MPTPEFVHKVTPDTVAEQIEKLRRLFPVVITEGDPCVDFDCVRPRRPAPAGRAVTDARQPRRLNMPTQKSAR